jgi:hypothetical protein
LNELHHITNIAWVIWHAPPSTYQGAIVFYSTSGWFDIYKLLPVYNWAHRNDICINHQHNIRTQLFLAYFLLATLLLGLQ